jgi:hypothetical protein
VPDQVTCTWTGASGKKYVYDVHARHPKLPPNEAGNYIYAKRDKQRRWVPIHIGEGNLTQRAATDRRWVDCINAKGATHVHVHVNSDRDDREAEVKDLLKNFPQAYTPEGCNEEKGG